MHSFYKPGSLTESDKRRLIAWQQKGRLVDDGKPGHQTVNELLDRITSLKHELHRVHRVLEAERGLCWSCGCFGFIVGLAVGGAVAAVFLP